MWVQAFIEFLSINNILYLIVGSIVGLIIGALPGLGPVFGLSLLLSMTFSMSVSESLIFLAAVYASCVYGGSISAILMNTPGTPGSIATTFDGFAMTERGEGGRALGASTASSFIGGVAGVIALAILGPPLAEVSLLIGPSEFFMLALAGLSLVSVASKGDTIRGLIMGGFGLMLSFVGRDAITNTARFTFDILYLDDGITFVPMVIGAFALAQALVLANSEGCIAKANKVSGVWQGVKETLAKPLSLIRGSLVGIVLGILPGVGINASNFIAYLFERSSAKDPETFGKGNIRGIIAPEVANNACTSSTLIPAFGLGIPGGSSAALFLAALMIHGATPGLSFFNSNELVFPVVIIGMFFAQVVFLIFGLIASNYVVKVTQIPNAVLVPIIVLLSFIGAFAYRNQILDVLMMIVFGFIGYCLMKYKYPMASLILGLILGTIAETNFSRTLRLSKGSFSIFVTRPISFTLLVIIVLSLCYPIIKPYLIKVISSFSQKRKEA